MTGAMMPTGADCVIMIEEVEELSQSKIKFKGEKTSNNICLLGEDVIVGQNYFLREPELQLKKLRHLLCVVM